MLYQRILIAIALLMQPALSFGEGGHKTFDLAEFQFEDGTTVPKTFLTYVTHGELNRNKSNLVLLPSWYSGDHRTDPGVRYDDDSEMLDAGAFERWVITIPSHEDRLSLQTSFALTTDRFQSAPEESQTRAIAAAMSQELDKLGESQTENAVRSLGRGALYPV